MQDEGTGRKILVVDDKPEIILLLQKVLKNRGYEVIGAGNGEEAIRTAEIELPDMILMDVRLPGGIDGLEATRRIKAMPHLAYIPIMAVTASVRPEDELQALDAGCSGFINKPIDINELPKQIAICIARASSTD
jgi:CheY-like chemotaxis protein